MSIGVKVSSVAVLLCCSASCSSYSSLEEDHARALIETMARRISGPPSVVHPDGSVSSEVSPVVPNFRIRRRHSVSWIHMRMEEEKDLLALKEAAVTPIAETLLDVDTNWELRSRLALLLGEIGDPRASKVLLDIARKDSNGYVRQCCWTGVGLLRSPELVPQLTLLSWTNIVEKKLVLWTRAMSGSQKAATEYVNMVEQVLRNEETETISDRTGLPTFWVDDRQKHLNLRAKKTPAGEFLHLDLWRIAHFRKPRIVGLLVTALRFHDIYVQHMALDLLERDVENGPKFIALGDFEIHCLLVHSKWETWWKEHGKHLRWDPVAMKYKSS